ncbi:transcription factor ILI7-like [Malania oleifera]|uniref:transcription factor ILI7-like n=1 Tax=Malania oleifera TaxID=397392 RepID=UPI0025ADD571|nr:transcription factor ILI7-like [Malania oleifera]
MSSRTSSTTQYETSKDLILKLRALMLDVENNGSRGSTSKVPLPKLLEEACSHIRRLQGEVGDLCGKIAELLAYPHITNAEEQILREVLQGFFFQFTRRRNGDMQFFILRYLSIYFLFVIFHFQIRVEVD